MSAADALEIVREYYKLNNPSEEEQFLFVEAMMVLIEKLKSPAYMMDLGGYYYEKKHFGLALKYYEMAAEYHYPSAYECLGYIWYYGRTGEQNFEKAFYYYTESAKLGNVVSQYKLADMYKNGYYVEKDYEKYKEIIEELYWKVKDAVYVNEPLPEIFTRLARIRLEEGKVHEAIHLFHSAKVVLEQRICYNPFFGNLSIMKGLIETVYDVVEFDGNSMDFYDLYYVLKKPVELSFAYKDKMHYLKSVMEDGECVICFDGKWYRTIDDFFSKACINGELLTHIYDELYDFRIVKGREV